MQKLQYFIYTDASFSRHESIAVSSFLIFAGVSAHENNQPLAPGLQTFYFKESNNIRAEFFGAIHALKVFAAGIKKEKLNIKDLEINLYSDCQAITKLLSRRPKLILTNYTSARKNTPLANFDLYKTFFSVYDELLPTVFWVAGHTKNIGHNLIQKHFKSVDKQARMELRSRVKTLYNTTY